uniref:Uncharacterized protein n=1 Tax=Rhizophora mucronata TaxID=61149 RepID=A0A2P2PVU4_RHIMU
MRNVRVGSKKREKEELA